MSLAVNEMVMSSKKSKEFRASNGLPFVITPERKPEDVRAPSKDPKSIRLKKALDIAAERRERLELKAEQDEWGW